MLRCLKNINNRANNGDDESDDTTVGLTSCHRSVDAVTMNSNERILSQEIS